MERESVPLREGLFTRDTEGGVLLASRCTLCGQVFFPKRGHCLDCLNNSMESVVLSRTGKLYTFTIVYMPTEHYSPPYAIGWVEFPEGVRVFGQIEGWEQQSLRIGMDMQVIIGKLWEEEEQEVIGYKFEPVV